MSKSIVSAVEALAGKIAEELSYDLWDVRFLKEGNEWFLRVFIDSPNGITIDDCEKMSRALDAPLDSLDLIQIPYCLEVCSPGLERELIKESHFLKFLNQGVKIKLFKKTEGGSKDICGKLLAFKGGIIELEDENHTILEINKKDTAYVKLDDFEKSGK